MLQRLRSFWTPLGVLDTVAVLAVIYVTIWSLHPSLLFSSTLITGGDTGSHLAWPAYLRTQGNLFDLTPWYPGWFAGMPAYTYYFVLPDYFATLASFILGFAVAFKLATVLGSVLLPVTAYVMGRLFRAPRPIPAALAMATLPFLFDASFTIDGGNLFSTMAGEYAFSLALALSLLAIGLFARGVRTGRGYWWAALALSATLASHVLPWFFTIAAVGVLVLFELLRRRGVGDPHDIDPPRGDYSRPFRFALGAGLLSVALSAWWLLPFITTQSLTNSMGYVNDNVSQLHSVFTTLGWFNATGGAAGDRWVIVLGAVAVVAAFIVRDRLGMVLATLTALSFAAFVYDPQSVIWNERLVPFWFLTIHLSAGWLCGYFLARWIRRASRARQSPGVEHVDEFSGDGVEAGSGYEIEMDPAQPHDDELDRPVDANEMAESVDRYTGRALRATLAVVVLGLMSTVPGLIPSVASKLHLSTSGNQVSSWAQWNYSGYQAKAAWPEYHDIMTTMQSVTRRYGCGRAMWEYSSAENRFGTPEALMLLPYWTNNCVDSMEGLFFESSATTPYHFLNQAELSAAPSDPQVGLAYGHLNVVEGVDHLQMLGVKYYMAFSPLAVAEASGDPQLKLVATTKKWPAPGATWRIYEIRNSPLVAPLTSLPNVVSGLASRTSWLSANTTWWLKSKFWPVLAASSGPRSWPRVNSIQSLRPTRALARVTVSHVVTGTQSISFHVNRTGIPVLVKISYFPRWHANGAAGPYRVSPNLMVVVPTSHDVSMTYGSSPTVVWGNVVSDLTALAAFASLGAVLQRRRKLRK